MTARAEAAAEYRERAKNASEISLLRRTGWLFFCQHGRAARRAQEKRLPAGFAAATARASKVPGGLQRLRAGISVQKL